MVTERVKFCAVHAAGRDTDDLYLAAALLRMKVDLDPRKPFQTFEPAGVKAPRFVFYFQERSSCGQYLTAELVKVWDDVEWMDAHPEHPWCYLWGMARYMQDLEKIRMSAAPMAEINERGIIGWLSMNADPEMTAKFFKRLKEHTRRGRRTRFG